MNKKILEFFKNPYRLLVWALICGGAYFIIVAQFVLKFTNTQEGGTTILWFFFPAIICGAALLLIKAVKRCVETENDKSILALFYAHLIIIFMAIVFLAAMFV